jgi:hypothetical protein
VNAMTSWARLPRLTWWRIGAAICVALIVFGAVTALLPRRTESAPTLMPIPLAPQDNRGAKVGVLTVQQRAAQQVAQRFVMACDTTDPAEPQGDVATEAALAPGLGLSHNVAEPIAWTGEQRTTTVALEPPGQAVAGPRHTVRVIVTGTMTVTSDSDPSQRVPIAEKVVLRRLDDAQPSGGGPGGDDWASEGGASGWRVVGVKVGT